jgi:K+-transporting ATPase c subunit
VKEIIDSNTKHPTLGFLGTDRINVLDLNLALDKSLALPPGAK